MRGELSDKLRQHAVPPGPALWQGLEARLQKRRRRRLAFWWGGGLGTLLLVGLGIWLWPGSQPDMLADSQVVQTTPKAPVASGEQTATSPSTPDAASAEGQGNITATPKQPAASSVATPSIEPFGTEQSGVTKHGYDIPNETETGPATGNTTGKPRRTSPTVVPVRPLPVKPGKKTPKPTTESALATVVETDGSETEIGNASSEVTRSISSAPTTAPATRVAKRNRRAARRLAQAPASGTELPTALVIEKPATVRKRKAGELVIAPIAEQGAPSRTATEVTPPATSAIQEVPNREVNEQLSEQTIQVVAAEPSLDTVAQAEPIDSVIGVDSTKQIVDFTAALQGGCHAQDANLLRKRNHFTVYGTALWSTQMQVAFNQADRVEVRNLTAQGLQAPVEYHLGMNYRRLLGRNWMFGGGLEAQYTTITLQGQSWNGQYTLGRQIIQPDGSVSVTGQQVVEDWKLRQQYAKVAAYAQAEYQLTPRYNLWLGGRTGLQQLVWKNEKAIGGILAPAPTNPLAFSEVTLRRSFNHWQVQAGYLVPWKATTYGGSLRYRYSGVTLRLGYTF